MADVQKQIDELKAELALAFAEATAAQSVLVNFMRAMRGSVPDTVLHRAFDEAANDLTIASMKFGSPDNPTHVPEILRIVEELRKIVFPR